MYVCLSVRLCGTVMYFETAQGIIKLFFSLSNNPLVNIRYRAKIYHMLNTGTQDIKFAIFMNISRHLGNSRLQRILIGNRL